MTTPTPIIAPNPPITLQPSTWYHVTAGCTNSACPRVNIVNDLPQVYSNTDGDPRIYCGICGQRDTMLTAAVLDPQPVMS